MGRRSTKARWALVPVAALAFAAAPALFGSSVAGDHVGSARAETIRISDGAKARAADRVPVDGSITITGTGWTAPAGGGSVIAVKLDDGDVVSKVSVLNPVTGVAVEDESVVMAVRASKTGSFKITVPLPTDGSWTAGSRHSVRLLSGRLLEADATRSMALSFDLFAAAPIVAAPSSTPTPAAESTMRASEAPSTAPSVEADSPTAVTESSSVPTVPTMVPSASSSPVTKESSSSRQGVAAPQASASGAASASVRPSVTSAERGGQQPGSAVGTSTAACASQPQAALTAEKSIRGVPTVDLGGTLILTGSGFCRPAGGGSTVGIQIDGGALAGPGTAVKGDPSIWQVAEADADGRFLVSVRLPEPWETDPEFADGSHRLRLVTGSLRKDDAVREVETGEFVVLAGSSAGTLPEPSASPEPPSPRRLVVANAGGVTGSQSGTTVRVVAPSLQPGDWVFPYAIGAESEAPPDATGAWVQLDADRSAVFELAATAKGAGQVTKISLQARDGGVVGWASLSSTQGSEAASPTPQVVGAGPPPAKHEAGHPRPLVLIAAGAPFLLGIGLLVDARRRQLRRIAEANQDFWT